MNRLAHELKIDPAVLRQRNLVTPAECPFYAGTVFQNGAKLIHQDCDYPAELDIVLKALDYDTVRATQDELRQKGTYRGVAIAFYVDGTGIARAVWGERDNWEKFGGPYRLLKGIAVGQDQNYSPRRRFR